MALRQVLTLDISQQKRAYGEAKREAKSYSDTSKRDVNAAHEDMGRSAGRMSGMVKTALAGVVAFIATRLLGALKAVTSQLFEISTAAEETESKFRTTFGSSAAVVDEFLSSFGRVAGLTQTEGREITATLGAMSQGFGLNQSAAAEFSKRVVRAAADMASFNNSSIENTLRAVQSGLIGEQEPLRRYGILLSAATVEQKALQMRSAGVTGELSEQEKVMARLALIYEMMGVQGGDLERTQGSTQNTMRRLTAEIRQQREAFATQLLPAFEQAVFYLGQLIDLYRDAADAAGQEFASGIVDVVTELIDLFDKTRAATEAAVDLALSFGDLRDDGEDAIGVLGRLGSTLDFLRKGFEGAALAWLGLRRVIGEADLFLMERTAVTAADRESVERQREIVDAVKEEQQAIRERIVVREFELELLREDRARRREISDLQRQAQAVMRGDLEMSNRELQKFILSLEIAAAEATHDKEEYFALSQALQAFARRAKDAADGPIEDFGTKLSKAVLSAKELAAALKELNEERFAVVGDRGMAFDLPIDIPDLTALDTANSLFQRVADLDVMEQSIDRLRHGLSLLRQAEENATDPILRERIRKLADEWGVFLDLAEGITPEIKRAAVGFDAFIKASRGITRLADSFGLLSDELSDVVSGAIDAADALQEIDQIKADTDLSGFVKTASLAAGWVGVVAGVATTVVGLIGAIQKRGEDEKKATDEQIRAMRDLAQSIKDSARSIRAQLSAILGEGVVGGDISASDLHASQARARQLRNIVESPTGTFAPGAAHDIIQSLIDAGVLDSGASSLFDDLLEQFGGDQKQAVAAFLQKTGLEQALADLAAAFGTFGDSVEGAIESTRFMGQFLGADLLAQFEHFVAFLADNVIPLGSDLGQMLKEVRGLDLSTPEGQSRLKEIVAIIAASMPQFLSGLDMSPDELQRILEQLLGFAEGDISAGGDEFTRSVQIARSITEIQANEMVVILDEMLIVLKQIRGLVGGSFPDYTGGVTPGNLPPALGQLVTKITLMPSMPVPVAPVQNQSFSASFGDINMNGPLNEQSIQAIGRVVMDELRRRSADPINTTFRRI